MFLKHIGQCYFESADLSGGAGGIGSGGDDNLSTVIAEASGIADPAAAANTDQPNPEEEKELAALEAEIRTKNPAMRGNIAIHRHQAVLTRTRNQHTKALEDWAAKQKAWEEEKAAHSKAAEEWKQYEWAKDPDIQAGLHALDLSERDQQKFAELLLEDPRYAAILQLKGKQEQAPPTGRPGPNQKSPDGTMEYYDDDGISKLLDWHGGTLKESLSKELSATIGKQMEEKYGKVADAYEATTLWNTALSEQKVVLDKMRNEWHGFKDHEPAIKAALAKNIAEREKDLRVPALSAETAYRQIVIPMLVKGQQADEQKMREKILAEMKEKKVAAGGVVKPAAVERSGEQGERDLADVIRASLPRE